MDDNAGGFELSDFCEERSGVDDNAVADHTGDVRVKHPGWDKMQDVLFIANAHRVSGIGPSLVAGDDVGVLGKHVDYFSLAFIAPLRPKDDLHWHR
jgi:hypothetical protein